MKNSSFTYRSFSVFTLMLLLSTFAVPATISAASLLCDMEMEGMHEAKKSCCIPLNVNDINNQAVTKTSEDCSFQRICEHTFSGSQSDLQAVQQIIKQTLIVILDEELSPHADEIQTRLEFNSKQPIAKEFPPIFLLNSTFLN